MLNNKQSTILYRVRANPYRNLLGALFLMPIFIAVTLFVRMKAEEIPTLIPSGLNASTKLPKIKKTKETAALNEMRLEKMQV